MTRSPLPALLLFLLPAIAICSGSALPAGDGYIGDDACAECHEDVSAAFHLTVHATASGWIETKGCESCHGPGAEHMDSEGEEGMAKPTELDAGEASATCLECHRRQRRQWHFNGNIHSLNDVGCVDCHNPHLTTAFGLRVPSTELCSSCHIGVAAQFELPRSHPLAPDEGCTRCHDPHGGSPRLAVSFGTDTCTECHFDKHGPFVFQHDVSVVEGCSACHEVHGTTNRHLLKRERQVNLCYECHPGTTTPTFHSFPGFLEEKCTACHTAIHGSNTSPFFLEE
jgi:DmsE family decaheme c-type cytochrome